MPQKVAGACLRLPGIFSVMFRYSGFSVTYESGLINIPEFDAQIEVYSQNKIVRIQFDTPYVKGLPVVMTIKERIGETGFQERKVRKTYMDPYTMELLELHKCVIEGKEPKTSALDARKDIELFQMILKAGVDDLRK